MKPIYEIATTFDGHVFATAEFEKIVSVWDVESGTRQCSFETHMDFGGQRLAISPNGKLCAAGAYHRYGISIYRVPSGDMVWTRKDLKRVQWLAFDYKEQHLLAGFDDKPLHMLNKKTGETIETLRRVRRKYFSPYGNMSLVEKRDLEIHDYKGKILIVKRQTFAVLAVAFAPRIIFLTEAGGSLRAIDGTEGSLLWEYVPPTGSHFLNIGYNEALQTLFGILWPYEKGGDYTLWEFDAPTGNQLSKSILVGGHAETEFAKQGSRLITSDGSIYKLEQKQAPILHKIKFAENNS